MDYVSQLAEHCFMVQPWVVVVAFFLDMLLGDPQKFPHPVRLIGFMIVRLEKVLRAFNLSGIFGGVLLVFGVIFGVSFFVMVVLLGAFAIHPYVGVMAQIIVVYFAIAMRDLDREVRAIYHALVQGEQGNIPLARERCARIVSRQTAQMDSPAIARSAIESTAENGVDGVLAPLFWVLLGGPLGVWIFKTISTLDSMVGYRTPQYEKFGKFSARLDDVLNWVPARLSLVLYPMGFALWFLWKQIYKGNHSKSSEFHANKAIFAKESLVASLRNGILIGLRDHALHASPNSGWSEAIMAGLLGVRLGGPAIYHGTLKNKPWFAGEFLDPQAELLLISLRIVWLAGLSLLFFVVLMA